jgi:hypothetical protein
MIFSNPSLCSKDDDGALKISRREAIRRAALMLGVALTPSLFSTALQAQSGVTTTVPGLQYLSESQRAMVAIIAERILPKTDTPGAVDAGVPDFINIIYGKYLNEDDKIMFSSGLDEVATQALKLYNKNIAQLSSEEQDHLLRVIARASQALPKSFFLQIKELTVVGYFTSELVGKTVLKYDPIPGRYDPCIPLSEVGNAQWTR